MMLRSTLCELIGTFALTFIGAGAILTSTLTGGQPDLLGIALAHALVLSIVVSATMNISGGHINPAVSIAMCITGRQKPGDTVCYVIAQCLGAVLAGLLLELIFRNIALGRPYVVTGLEAITTSKLGTPNFGPNITTTTAVIVEIALTFLLVFAIFGTAVDPRAPRIGGFGIGLTVGVDILMGGPITGAAMNPARTLGPLLAGGSATADLWAQHWVYWVGPVLGAVLAAVLYDRLILRPDSTPAAPTER